MAEGQTYRYWLPDKDGEQIKYETQVNSLIIIGANGSGKSKLGAWMEQRDGDNIHRVAAQRSLNFSEHIPLKSYAESEGELFYGSPDKTHWQSNKGVRWDWGKGYTTKLVQDFDAVLSALLAQYNNVVQQYYEECKKAEKSGNTHPCTSDDPLNKLYNIWDAVFPQRRLKMNDSSFIAVYQDGSSATEYSATEMSDGERSVLYLAAQVLCIPANKTIIVDEPEVHLHPSLMGRLWKALEAERPDCLFVFITHDVQFAAMHGNSDKIWVKSFDGECWDLAQISNSELPEQLLFELLGNRKPVLFVEGNGNSYDVQLYSALYPKYYIVPCGGCSQVIANTKAFSSTPELHDFKAYGIIDRDFRDDSELDNLQKKGVYCLQVAEVENLFLVEPLLRVMANRFACSDVSEVIDKIKCYVIHDRFAKQLNQQICQATVNALNELMGDISINGGSDTEIMTNFSNSISNLNPQTILSWQKKRYEEALNSGDYEDVLRVFNCKSLSKSIGHYFGIDDKQYCSKVMMLASSNAEDVIGAITLFVPSLPA